jgi:hypothetical protein
MYNLNDIPGPLQARGLFAPLASQGSTLSRKDSDQAKPNQSGIHPDQQQTSVKTVSAMFDGTPTHVHLHRAFASLSGVCFFSWTA